VVSNTRSVCLRDNVSSSETVKTQTLFKRPTSTLSFLNFYLLSERGVYQFNLAYVSPKTTATSHR